MRLCVCLSVCPDEQYKQKQQRRHHVITSSVNLERVPVQAIRLCPVHHAQVPVDDSSSRDRQLFPTTFFCLTNGGRLIFKK
jgi:hypothetical protein